MSVKVAYHLAMYSSHMVVFLMSCHYRSPWNPFVPCNSLLVEDLSVKWCLELEVILLRFKLSFFRNMVGHVWRSKYVQKDIQDSGVPNSWLGARTKTGGRSSTVVFRGRVLVWMWEDAEEISCHSLSPGMFPWQNCPVLWIHGSKTFARVLKRVEYETFRFYLVPRC